MGTIFGATLQQSPQAEADLRYDVIGKNSEVFTSGDLVTVSSGVLQVASATSQIVGVVVKTQTMSSNNATVAKVQPGYIPTNPANVYLMGSNGDFTGTATDAGTYYKITGTTGAQQVDQASGVQTTTSRVVEILEVDPFNEGGTGAGSGLRKVTVRIVKSDNFNVPTSA